MKKIASWLLVVSLFFAVSFSNVTPVKAETTELGTRLKNSNTFYNYVLAEKTLYINGYGDIPNLYNSTSSIPWLEWPASKIQKVVVSEGITSLGNYVFYSVAAKEFQLPSTLKRIGRYALAYTNGMTKWSIPFGVETLDDYAFNGCTAMLELEIPSSVKKIGSNAFSVCSYLTKVTIPESVSYIGSKAFYRCVNLQNVEFASLSQSIDIETDAFLDCQKLKSVILPKNAACSMRAFGYISATVQMNDFSMSVFGDSPGYLYAQSNEIPYTIIDSIPVECGVAYNNSFGADELTKYHLYTITPKVTQNYVIYTSGECDTLGELYYMGECLAESDDIDNSNRGFCIRYNLQAGETYELRVKTGRMEAAYSLHMYPDSITSFDVISGSLTMSADSSRVSNGVRIYPITLDLMNDFAFEVGFADGSSYKMYFNSYIAGEYVQIADEQTKQPFTCGENQAYLSLAGAKASYPFFVEHSYTSSTVAPTEDDDGYDLFTCISCATTYKDNFVETTSFIVTGLCVMDEDNFGTHNYDVPYNNAYVTVDNRRYEVNEDGTFAIRTFTDCWAVIHNLYGGNVTIKIDVSNGNYHYGSVALEPYDLNRDGIINGKDYALYYRFNRERLGDDYWRFGDKYY